MIIQNPTCNYPKTKPVNEINRLILIGNGFDLAHGYKTRYSDFIYDYLKNTIRVFFEKKTYRDDLISISYKYANAFYEVYPSDNLDQLIKELNRIGNSEYFTLKYNSKLLSNIIQKLGSLRNWVDIENEYYQLLKFYLENNEKEQIIKLNSDLDFISKKLEDYLIRETSEAAVFSGHNFLGFFYEKVLKEDIVFAELVKDLDPKSIQILNFNYTDILNNYTVPNKNIAVSQNYIHGKLSNKENPIIFGFGDELDEKYLELEKMNDNKLFRHIKSFKYFKTQNYHNLIRFIDSNAFQVYIVGHSCGLSDRTMLNQVFEHDNCVSIKIFYHLKDDGSNDYTEKTHEISRHFRDKGIMRKKITPEVSSHPIPKPKKLE